MSNTRRTTKERWNFWHQLVAQKKGKRLSEESNHNTTIRAQQHSTSNSSTTRTHHGGSSSTSTSSSNNNNMRRVSSRQRLVSWDANDATAIGFAAFSEPSTCSNENDNKYQYDSYEEDNDGLLDISPSSSISNSNHGKTSQFSFFTAMAPKKRKRKGARTTATSLSNRMVHVIPQDDTETSLPHLPNDIWCQVHHYLTKPDVQSLLCVNLHHRRLALHHTAIWERWVAQQWPHVYDATNSTTTTTTSKLSTQTTRLLTRHAWAPTGPQRCVIPRSSGADSLWEWQDDDNTTFRYTGATNTGDRCIKADAPLCSRGGGKSGRRRLLRPIATDNEQSIRMQPTLLSYFEITIRAHPSDDASSERDPDAVVVDDDTTSNTEFCIAIGLATAEFGVTGRQPGWDSLSYGWHGDDGGLFHGAGSMRVGPLATFGPGDTVGCGIVASASSHKPSRICFTKNGECLGTPFALPSHTPAHSMLLRSSSSSSRKDTATEWYPVIGVDAPHTISCNFGAQPFAWDLQLPKK